MAKGHDHVLDCLLNMNGAKFFRDDGYWYQFEAKLTERTPERPHGLSYSLTLHDKHNKRVFGIDNAHGYDFKKNRFSGRRVVYDHKHQEEKVFPYDFVSPGRLMEDFFKGLTLLSVPVLKGEAFGLYQLEALASGIPIVQPAVGAFPEVVKATGGGAIYEPNTPEALSEKLAEVLSDPQKIRQFSTNGNQAIGAKFNSTALAKRMVSIYKTLSVP